MKMLIALWIAALAVLVGPARAATEARLLKAGIGLNADTPQGRGLRKFAELVEARSQGRIRIELFAGGKLGDDLTMVNALRQGTQDITCPDSSTLARIVKDFSVVNYPFTFLDETEADHVLDGAWGSQVMSALPANGLVGLAFWENGFRHLTNSQRAITNLTQAKGLRMRTMQNQMLIDSFTELGFDAVPMPFPKVYAALADKQVDGQENPLPTILSSRFYEVQQHLTLSRHVYSAFVLLISKATWDSLAPADQSAVAAAAIEARDFQRRVNREVTAAALEQLKKLGMRVTSIDVRDAETVRRRLRSVLEKYNKEIGEGSVISMYVALSQWRAGTVQQANQAAREAPALAKPSSAPAPAPSRAAPAAIGPVRTATAL
jgi:TRAP-type transport system periplasmic protein